MLCKISIFHDFSMTKIDLPGFPGQDFVMNIEIPRLSRFSRTRTNPEYCVTKVYIPLRIQTKQ